MYCRVTLVWCISSGRSKEEDQSLVIEKKKKRQQQQLVLEAREEVA